MTFKTIFEGDGQKVTGKAMAMASPQRMRLEQDLPNKQKVVTISDDYHRQLDAATGFGKSRSSRLSQTSPKRNVPRPSFSSCAHNWPAPATNRIGFGNHSVKKSSTANVWSGTG